MRKQRGKKKRAKARKDEVVPRGRLFMPGVRLIELLAALVATNDDTETLKLQAAIQRRKGKDIRKIARDQGKGYSTVWNRLFRMHTGGLERVKNKPRGGSKSKINHAVPKAIRKWLGNSPTRYGYEAGGWQLVMIQDMMYKTFGKKCSDRTLRYVLHNLGYSYRKTRPVPAKSAPRDKRKKFVANANATIAEKVKRGFVVLFLDETHVRLDQDPSYAWRRTNGKDTANTRFSMKTVTVFGVLGIDGYHMRTAKACNSGEFMKFLREMKEIHPKMLIILDNAPYHKSKAVREFVEGTDGAVELLFLPAYTPQLNPIETQWRALKRLLHGRYFASVEELEATIMSLVDKGQMSPVKISQYEIPA